MTVKGGFFILVEIPKSGDSDSHMIVTLREENHYENGGTETACGCIGGKTYQINAPYLTAIKKGLTWSKVEDKAIEDEILLAVKNFVNDKFKLPVEIFPS